MSEDKKDNLVQITHLPAPEPAKTVPKCEKNIEHMLSITLLPLVNSKNRIISYCIPTLVNILLIGASFCLLYYPTYYPTQGEIWTTDIVLSWGTYNYMIYLFKHWDIAKCFEEVEVTKSVNYTSLIFYWLYILYWLYFTIIQFSTHNEQSVLIQLGNTLMSTAWFIFFSIMAVLYYFVCIKLSQLSLKIRSWLKSLKTRKLSLDDFYVEYNKHYKSIKDLAKYWNILIFIGTLLLTFHVPIDVISVIYKHYYYDIFGLVVKLLSLLWYVWRICDLNENESYVITYLHKHRLFSYDELKAIAKYTEYRPLGLNFYGLKVNKAFITKVLLLTLNLVIPTIYALISNKIF